MPYQLQLGTLNLRAKIKQSFCTIQVWKCVKKNQLFEQNYKPVSRSEQKSEYIFYRTAVGNGSIWLGKFWKIPCFGMTLWTCIWYECNFIQPCKGVGLVGVVHPPSSPIEKGRKYSQKITFLLLMTDKSCDMWEARFEIWSL